MAFSTALWEAISGRPWPYSNRTSSNALLGNGIVEPGEIGDTGMGVTDTQRRFAWFFGGYDPVTGVARAGGSNRHPQAAQHGISSYESLTSRYPTPAPAPKTKAPPVISGGPSAMDAVLQGGGMNASAPKPKPKPPVIPENYQPPPVVQMKVRGEQEITADDIDRMIMKVNNLSLERFPNEARWVLSKAKKRLQQLTERERAFLRDPFIPDEQKENFLRSITAFDTPDDMAERWARRQLDRAIRLGSQAAARVRKTAPMRPFEGGEVFSPYSGSGTIGPLSEDMAGRSPIIGMDLLI